MPELDLVWVSGSDELLCEEKADISPCPDIIDVKRERRPSGFRQRKTIYTAGKVLSDILH